MWGSVVDCGEHAEGLGLISTEDGDPQASMTHRKITILWGKRQSVEIRGKRGPFGD